MQFLENQPIASRFSNSPHYIKYCIIIYNSLHFPVSCVLSSSFLTVFLLMFNRQDQSFIHVNCNSEQATHLSVPIITASLKLFMKWPHGSASPTGSPITISPPGSPITISPPSCPHHHLSGQSPFIPLHSQKVSVLSLPLLGKSRQPEFSLQEYSWVILDYIMVS